MCVRFCFAYDLWFINRIRLQISFHAFICWQPTGRSVLYGPSSKLIIVLAVIIGADFTFFIARVFLLRRVLTQLHLVVKRIEQVLHKIVAFFAVYSIWTLGESFVKINIHAPFCSIEKVLRRPTKILQPMGEVTNRPIVLVFYLWAKRRFVAVNHELVN